MDIAILATALAWGIVFFVADKRIHLFGALATGSFVVLIGYRAATLGALPWLVIAALTSMKFVLLWYVMHTLWKMATA